MILANGTKVVLTGGHYVNIVKSSGLIKAHRNSARDGDSYIIAFPGFGEVQIKAKFVSKEITASVAEETGEVSELELYKNLEGHWVTFKRGSKIFEHSEPLNDYELKYKLSCGQNKNVLVTLVYEEDGEVLANVVFQGMYAVVRASELSESTDNPGAA